MTKILKLKPVWAWLIWLTLLSALLSGFKASAYYSNDVVTLINAYTNAFYVVSGTNGYFRERQGSSTATYFWQQANEIESVIDAYEWTGNAKYQRMITNLLNGFIKNNGANWAYNGYNDDDLWAVMAFARGGQITGKTAYCAIAKANFDLVYARAWDTNLGGGLYWLYPKNHSKNACVNGPGAIAAYLLYQIYGDTNYLNKATNIYAWERAVLYNASTGRVYDNINTNGTVDQTPTTYNQGTFIGAADFLGQTNDARLAANYTLNSMNGAGFMPRYGIGGNNSIFNSIFIRWLAKFMKHRGVTAPYQIWLQNQANTAWNERRASDNLSWCQWPLPTPAGTNFYSYDCISSFEAMLAVPPTQTNSPTAVRLLAADEVGGSSFESGLHWQDGLAPASAHDYVVSGFTLRTPADNANHYFAGSSLTLSNAAILALKNTGGSVGVSIGTDLFLDDGEVADWAANTATFYANVTLRGGGGKFDPQGNTFNILARIGGPGFLRVKATTSVQTGGTLIFSGHNTYTGGTIIDAAHTVRLSGAGTLGSPAGSLTFSNSAGYGYGAVDLNGLNLSVGNLSGAGGSLYNGSANPCVLTIGAGNADGGVFQGSIANGAGGLALVKTGAGKLTFSRPQIYTGNTTIGAGILALTASGSVAGSVQIVISNAAILDVTGRSDQTLTLNNGQSLRGSGEVRGNLLAQAGSLINPGDAIGALRIQNNITLAGTLWMELNRAATPPADELISSAGTITSGGTLTVTNLGAALQAGDTFQLFNTPVSGFAVVNLPAVSSGLTWMNRLALDGSIQVLPVAATNPPNLAALTVSGNALKLSWPADHIGWRLQAQTNASGAGLGTNWQDVVGSGATNQITLPLDATKGSVFFRLKYP